MQLKKAKYKKIRVWGKKQISPDVYGCDCCKEVLKNYPNEDNRLDISVWPNKNSSEYNEVNTYHFCSWDCVLKFIPKIKSTYFASMPSIHFDSKGKGSATEFIQALKNISKK